MAIPNISGFARKAQSAIPKTPSLSNVTSQASSAISGITSQASSAVSGITNQASSVVSGITNQASSAVSGIKSAASNALSSVKSAVPDLSIAKNAGNIVGSAVSKASGFTRKAATAVGIPKITAAIPSVKVPSLGNLKSQLPDITPPALPKLPSFKGAGKLLNVPSLSPDALKPSLDKVSPGAALGLSVPALPAIPEIPSAPSLDDVKGAVAGKLPSAPSLDDVKGAVAGKLPSTPSLSDASSAVAGKLSSIPKADSLSSSTTSLTSNISSTSPISSTVSSAKSTVSSLSSTVSSRTVSGGGATIVKADGTTEFVPRVPGTADLPELEDDDF